MRTFHAASVSSKPDHGRPGLQTDQLYNLSATLLAVLPVAMVVSTRSSPALLTAAALAALGGVALEGGASALIRQAGARMREPIGLACLAFGLWAILSLAWSPVLPLSLHVLGEFALPVMSAFLLALVLPGRIDAGFWARAATLAALFAGVLIVLDLETGLALRRELGGNSIPFALNRPALTLLVLVPGLAVLLARAGQSWLAILIAGIAALATLRSISGAAKLGLAVGLMTFLLAWAERRVALALVAMALLGSIAVAPMLGDLADRALPKSLLAQLARAHAQDRVDIWRSFGAAVREQPLAGAGFGTSAAFGDAPVATKVRSEFRPLLDVGHPHNAPLQIWAELGVIGAALAALIVAFTLRAVEPLGGPPFAAALALAAGGLAASLVGQGAWQGWWPAGIGASLVWFRLAERDRV